MSLLFAALAVTLAVITDAGNVAGAEAVPTDVDAAPSCVACGVDADADRARYSAVDWAALTAGEVLTSIVADDVNGRATVEAAAIVPAPPLRVWETLVDFPARPRFQPGTQEVRVVRTEGERVWVAQHLRFFGIDVRFTIINTLDPSRGVLRWILDESAPHDIAATTGTWRLARVEAGQQTLVVYRGWTDTGRYVPGFVERFLTGRSLPKLMTGLRDEVARRCAVHAR
jgi:hypothetical protein